MNEEIEVIEKLEISTEDMHGMVDTSSYKAQKIRKEKGIIYKYSDEFGATTIFVYQGKVRIVRKGEINCDMIMSCDEYSEFDYITPHTRSRFLIKTNLLEIENKKIAIKYTLYDSDTVINEIKIVVKEGS